MILLSLIGEQPIPNLLPILHFAPAFVVLAYSSLTEKAAERLKKLLPAGCTAMPCPVDAYDIAEIRQSLDRLIEEQKWSSSDLILNLTGGTKAMAMAAYQVAIERRCDFLYLQSEGKQSKLYRYQCSEAATPQLIERRIVPSILNIDHYLCAFVGTYQTIGNGRTDEQGRKFERAIFAALQPPHVDEILAGVQLQGALDVDFVVRCGNHVGIIEAKTGAGLKKGIDQLNTAGGQRFLGTYTQKMLVSDQVWDDSRSNLRELAAARQITVIELPSFGQTGSIAEPEQSELIATVQRCLGKQL